MVAACLVTRSRRIGVALSVAAVGLVGVVAPSVAAPALTRVVVSPATRAVLGVGVSGDGRYVVWQETDRVTTHSNVVVRWLDRRTRRGEVMSVDPRGRAVPSPEGYSEATEIWPEVSDDGRYVAFLSTAVLTKDDVNGTHSANDGSFRGGADVFLRDRVRRRTVLVTRSPERQQFHAFPKSFTMAPDGSWVLFVIMTGRDSGHVVGDLFLWRRATGRTQLVAREVAPAGVSLSRDGLVAYAQLVRGGPCGPVSLQVVVADVDRPGARRDVASAGLPCGQAPFSMPRLSRDGRVLVFAGLDTLYRRDVRARRTAVVEGVGPNPIPRSISGDGRVVAFVSERAPADIAANGRVRGVFVADVRGVRELTAGAPRGTPGIEGCGDAPLAWLHADWCDQPWKQDPSGVVLHRAEGQTNWDNGVGPARFDGPLLTVDGRTVFFGATAPLAADDNDRFRDLYVGAV